MEDIRVLQQPPSRIDHDAHCGSRTERFGFGSPTSLSRVTNGFPVQLFRFKETPSLRKT